MRPGWVEYFMEMAFLVSKRSTCLRRKVGAVAVKDRRIIATGYNGQVRGTPHCQTCLREELDIPSGQREELCLAIHAEMNIVIQCAIYGVSIKEAQIYCTARPCISCFKVLANCGISEVIYKDPYSSPRMDHLLDVCGFVDEEFGVFRRLRRRE